MYGLRNMLVCLSEPVQVTDNNKTTLAYYEICPFSVDYELVMFYRTGPRLCYNCAVMK
jgi:hypothetical protein